MFSNRHLARITMETTTPLALSSGETGEFYDTEVLRDAGGLIYVPGSALAGVVSHMLGKPTYFGFHDATGGKGSRVYFTDARPLDAQGKVLDGQNLPEASDPLWKELRKLEARDRVRINHRGAADSEGHGKFDRELIPSGLRFTFEVELWDEKEAQEPQNDWETLLQAFYSPLFRLGGGTRTGYGGVKMISCKHLNFNLSVAADRKAYLEKSSLLSETFPINAKEYTPAPADRVKTGTVYTLTLKPEDWFLFSSGKQEKTSRADRSPLKNRKSAWKDGKFAGWKTCYTIPGSSVKGALSHRTAWHYNRLKGIFADTPGLDPKAHTGESNAAVKYLFGTAAEKNAVRGRLIIDDLMWEPAAAGDTKIIPHIHLDRFTQAPIDGALFDEEVIHNPELTLTLNILLEDPTGNLSPGEEDIEDFKKAWELSLDDLTRGFLPLGGSVMKGQGCFTGSWNK